VACFCISFHNSAKGEMNLRYVSRKDLQSLSSATFLLEREQREREHREREQREREQREREQRKRPAPYASGKRHATEKNSAPDKRIKKRTPMLADVWERQRPPTAGDRLSVGEEDSSGSDSNENTISSFAIPSLRLEGAVNLSPVGTATCFLALI